MAVAPFLSPSHTPPGLSLSGTSHSPHLGDRWNQAYDRVQNKSWGACNGHLAC